MVEVESSPQSVIRSPSYVFSCSSSTGRQPKPDWIPNFVTLIMRRSIVNDKFTASLHGRICEFQTRNRVACLSSLTSVINICICSYACSSIHQSISNRSSLSSIISAVTWRCVGNLSMRYIVRINAIQHQEEKKKQLQNEMILSAADMARRHSTCTQRTYACVICDPVMSSKCCKCLFDFVLLLSLISR